MILLLSTILPFLPLCSLQTYKRLIELFNHYKNGPRSTTRKLITPLGVWIWDWKALLGKNYYCWIPKDKWDDLHHEIPKNNLFSSGYLLLSSSTLAKVAAFVRGSRKGIAKWGDRNRPSACSSKEDSLKLGEAYLESEQFSRVNGGVECALVAAGTVLPADYSRK